MGLFQDFKDDVSQAVNELMDEASVENMENTDANLDEELQSLFGDDEQLDTAEVGEIVEEDAPTTDEMSALFAELGETTKLSEMDATLGELAGDDAFPEDAEEEVAEGQNIPEEYQQTIELTEDLIDFDQLSSTTIEIPEDTATGVAEAATPAETVEEPVVADAPVEDTEDVSSEPEPVGEADMQVEETAQEETAQTSANDEEITILDFENMEDNKMANNEEIQELTQGTQEVAYDTADFDKTPADEDTATITKGTKIAGNIETSGSLEVIGTIEGDITCKGKLVVSGIVKGISNASEIYTDGANVTGDMKSDGSVKVGVGSVIVGNIKATSAVIAGAVKGNIDIDGPVIIDSTAVVMGDVTSRSVQINNGAVMEGKCSQSHSDIDINTFFEN